MASVFNSSDVAKINERINKLTPESQAKWGKMDVSQMLAHCCVSYEMVFEQDRFSKPKGIKKWMMNWFVKPVVVNSKPYKKNSPTAPEFKIVDQRGFDFEKSRLINYIEKTLQMGESQFEGKESVSFGKLDAAQWNNLFFKHLDHHLSQFGA